MTKIYFASPLFSEMELAFNKVLVEKNSQPVPRGRGVLTTGTNGD